MSKPLIETIINTSAITLSAFGTNLILMNDGDFVKGMFLVVFSASMEFIKYYGRKKKLWR